MSDSSGPSLWEWTVPDEGYCTGKDHELPEMIDSARKELECPICMEIMAPPSRIWQCRVSYKYRYTQLLRNQVKSSQIDCQGQYECLSVSGFIYEVLHSLSTYIYSIQSLNRGHTNCVCVVVLSSLSVAWCVVSVAPVPDLCRDSNMQI